MDRKEQKLRRPQWVEAVSYGWLGERKGKVSLAMGGTVSFIEKDFQRRVLCMG